MHRPRALVVDRKGYEARFKPPGSHRLGKPAGVAADDANRNLRVTTREVFDEFGGQEVVRRTKVPSDAVPPVSVRAR